MAFEQCLSMLLKCCLLQTLTHVSSSAHVSFSIQMLQLIDFQRHSAECMFKSSILGRLGLMAHVKTSPFSAEIHGQSLSGTSVQSCVLKTLSRLRSHVENLLNWDLFQFYSEMLNEKVAYGLLPNKVFSKAVFITIMHNDNLWSYTEITNKR